MVPRPLRRLMMPADTYDRHATAAVLCGKPDSVLDVGGISGELGLFLPGAEVSALNVEGDADRIFDGATLPYPDDSFDVVTSLDVIEHIPPAGREPHLRELARVARRRVVLCCPLGSEGHVEAERELGDWYERATGARHRFLDEHLRNGLPTKVEIESLATEAGLAFELFFHGDYRSVNRVFRLSVEARRSPRALLGYARARLTPGRASRLAPEPAPHSNRLFLLVTVGLEPG